MEGKMKEKQVLITGGVRGLGKAMSQLLAAEGAAVWVTSRRGQAPEKVMAPTSGEIKEVYLDVSREKSVQDLFAEIKSKSGRLDVLINNAGIGVFKPIVETSLTEWEEVFSINMRGTFLCSREAFSVMQEQGGGRIINIASISGFIPIVENGAYGASKYAVRGFSKILNEEGKDKNIRVSIVSPGAVYTDIWEGREGFDPGDMLQEKDIAETILDIAHRPLHVRIDEVKILPPKGVL